MTNTSNVTLGLRKALFFAGLGVLGFSGTLPATRVAVPYFGPLWMGLGRAVFAAILAGILLVWGRAPWPTRRQVPGLLTIALCCVIGFPLLSARALQDVPASHASVIIAFAPIATAIIAVLRGGERPSSAFWAASAFGSFVVVCFAFGGGTGGTDGGIGFQPADLWLALAVFLASVGYVEGARLTREMGGLRVIAWSLVLVAVPLTIVLALNAPPNFSAVTAGAWFGFAYVSAISMFGAFVAWYAGLAGAGIARGSQLQLLQPLLSILWCALFVGETPSPRIWLAAGLVVACIAVAARARSRPAGALHGSSSPGHATAR